MMRFLLLGFLALSIGAQAAVITVTNSNDSGVGSLRDSIALATNGDSIVFANDIDVVSVVGTLAIGEKNISINGDKNNDGLPDVTLKGTGVNNVLSFGTVTTGVVLDLNINGLIFENVGLSFVAFAADASVTVTLRNSEVIDNQSGGIGNGVNSTLFLQNVRVSGNRASGIVNSGTVYAINTLFSGNYSESDGGAIVSFGPFTLINSTITGNAAKEKGGAAFVVSFPLTVINSVIWNNLDENGVGTGLDFDDFGEGQTTLFREYSLIQGLSGGSDGNLDGLAQQNANYPLFKLPLDPQNAPSLAGEFVLQNNSPLIDQGDNAKLKEQSIDLNGDGDTQDDFTTGLDVAGDPRLQGARVNIGAYESLFVPTSNVPVLNSFSINNGATTTDEQVVTLDQVISGAAATEYQASESSTFDNAAWQPYVQPIILQLSAGNGEKTVYFRVRNAEGESAVLSDSIELLQALPVVDTFAINNGAAETASVVLTLNHSYSQGTPTEYQVSRTSTFSDAEWKPYVSVPTFALDNDEIDGTKTLYFALRNAAGESMTLSDSIILKRNDDDDDDGDESGGGADGIYTLLILLILFSVFRLPFRKNS